MNDWVCTSQIMIEIETTLVESQRLQDLTNDPDDEVRNGTCFCPRLVL